MSYIVKSKYIKNIKLKVVGGVVVEKAFDYEFLSSLLFLILPLYILKQRRVLLQT